MTLADEVGVLRAKCVELHGLHSQDDQLGGALSGLCYAFKSLKFAPPRIADLLSGDYREVVESNSADEACYHAEAMIRSVHACGDLLAQAVDCCVLNRAVGRDRVSLSRVLERADLDPDVAKLLRDIQDSPQYEYVSEFSNATKHREFIERTVPHVDNHHRIDFEPFTGRDGFVQRARRFEDVVADCRWLLDESTKVVDVLIRKALSRGLVATASDAGGPCITGTPMVPDYARYVTDVRSGSDADS